MNVRHSPPKGPIMSGNSDCPIAPRSVIAGSSGSQPDLRKPILYASDSDLNQVTFRHKRKHSEESLDSKFDAFECRIMAFLNNIAKSQNETLNTISQDISSIKDQLKEMKLTTDRLAEEQYQFKQQLVTISNFNTDTDNRISVLESKIDTLKTDTVNRILPTNCDNVISEIHERFQREKNLIIVGIDEISTKNVEERRSHDMSKVNSMIKSIGVDCAQPTKVIRIGKYDRNRTRPIKACFETSDTPKLILRNKIALQNTSAKLKIYSDETPLQRKMMQTLRDELKHRTEAGEKDLIIKYIKGVPKIVQQHSKN